jgi:hypothetical protein
VSSTQRKCERVRHFLQVERTHDAANRHAERREPTDCRTSKIPASGRIDDTSAASTPSHRAATPSLRALSLSTHAGERRRVRTVEHSRAPRGCDLCS